MGTSWFWRKSLAEKKLENANGYATYAKKEVRDLPFLLLRTPPPPPPNPPPLLLLWRSALLAASVRRQPPCGLDPPETASQPLFQRLVTAPPQVHACSTPPPLGPRKPMGAGPRATTEGLGPGTSYALSAATRLH